MPISRWDGDRNEIRVTPDPVDPGVLASITIYVRPILKNKIPFVIDGRDYT